QWTQFCFHPLPSPPHSLSLSPPTPFSPPPSPPRAPQTAGEQNILGSIPLPSYDISAADPADRKSRKFSFKAEHPGMRTYHFSADTQEDMSGWVRAMNQSARVESQSSRCSSGEGLSLLPYVQRCSSFGDFTKSGFFPNSRSAESLEIAK
uniref:PH domain-containing protein n=1 Tax=Callorhinchus milii TaxID=7868 RepID=A0A4W3J8J3_CALMI